MKTPKKKKRAAGGVRHKPFTGGIKADSPSFRTRRQLKFECTEEFYEHVMQERTERHLTLLELGVRAFERYFAVPEWMHRGIDDIVAHSGEGKTLAALLSSCYAQCLKPEIAGPRVQEQQDAVTAASSETDLEVWGLSHEIGECLKQLPVEKLRLLRESLFLDLKYYRSARVKPAAADERTSTK